MLCSQCQKIDLSPLLSREDWPEGYIYIRGEGIQLGPLNSLLDRASTSNVCKMVCDALEEMVGADKLTEKLCVRGGSYRCSLAWVEHGQGSTRTDVSFSGTQASAMFRLDIPIWRQTPFGLDSQTLRNIFQPASSPVPQFESAREPSQFWNTLGNSRLRSPICEPKLLRTWLSKCESSHSMCWWTGPKASLRLRLFDVKFRCVRKLQLSLDITVRYVALSYVWGSQARRLTLTRVNHKVLS